MTTQNLVSNTDANDGFWYPDYSSLQANLILSVVGDNGGKCNAFYRFQLSADVARYSVVSSASFEPVAVDTASSTLTYTAKIHKVANSGAIVSAADLDSRTYTAGTAFVNKATTGGVRAAHAIAAELQELVDSTALTSGDYITVVLISQASPAAMRRYACNENGAGTRANFDFTYSPPVVNDVMPAAAGSFALTGVAAGTKAALKDAGAAGSLSLTGVSSGTKLLAKTTAIHTAYAFAGNNPRPTYATLYLDGSIGFNGWCDLYIQSESLQSWMLYFEWEPADTIDDIAGFINAAYQSATGTLSNIVEDYEMEQLYLAAPDEIGNQATAIEVSDFNVNDSCYIGDYALGTRGTNFDTSQPSGAGSYTTSGVAADLRYVQHLVAEAGSFAMTGQDIAFTPTIILRADPAGTQPSHHFTCSFATGGQFVFSVTAFGFPYLTDSIVWDGASSATLKTLIETEINDKLTALGSAATCTVTITVPTGVVEGTISFYPPMPMYLLVWSQTPNSSGSMMLSDEVTGVQGFTIPENTDTILRHQQRVAHDAESFVMTGSDANFTLTQAVAGAAGEFLLAGVGSTSTITMSAEPGDFGLTGEETLKYDTEITVDVIVIRYPARIPQPELELGIELELQTLPVRAVTRMTGTPYFPVETTTSYVENSKHQVVMGSGAGVFKFNPTARTSKSGVLHLAAVKPNIQTRSATFTLLVNVPYIPAGGFTYVAPGGYLTITNPDPIELTLVQDDSGNGYVSMAPIVPDPPVLVSDFYQ